jgi:hypothetical protein
MTLSLKANTFEIEVRRQEEFNVDTDCHIVAGIVGGKWSSLKKEWL